MTYSTSTIGAVIGRLNTELFLPAIQRPFVWKPSQLLALFDSLLKGYPVSSFMFWEVNDDTKREVRIYRFFENYRAGDTLNEPVQPDGRKVVLVLDGQQRLTSFLIGLRGTYSEKDRYARKNNPDAWSRYTLYLDLLKDPDAPDEEENEQEFGVTYGLKFLASAPRNSNRHHWIRLGMILDHPTPEHLDRLAERTRREMHHGVTAYEADVAIRNLRRLHQAIWVDEAVNYYTETSQAVDRVLDIFVRANDGGTKLSKSDLLMSMITSKWSSGTAREDIFGFVEHINRSLGPRNNINRDFALKACLVFCDVDVQYNVSNFTQATIEMIETNWKAIKTAIENTFRLLNSFGITEKNLTSLNAVLPIAYYLYRSPEYSFRGQTEFERSNARQMQKWLLQSLLMGTFAGSSDRTISLARNAIRENLKQDRNFPAARLYYDLAIGGRLTRLDDRAIEEILELKYSQSKTFLALSLIYDDLDWVGTSYHIDHIIPQASAHKRVLMGQNLQDAQIQRIIGAVDKLANLQLLSNNENLEKSDISFDTWITTRDRHYRERHLIGERVDHWRAVQLPEFVAEREKLIYARLKRLVEGPIA